PHTDVVGLTLLLQVNDVQGLQIKRDGKWFSVDALSGAFIVNIGDTLEVMTEQPMPLLVKAPNKQF
ncbi:hypothetical protein L9G15_26220, partial [Shewanella sp. A3A]|nr:hypothetical protein [Shewanella ferrihydritica]